MVLASVPGGAHHATGRPAVRLPTVRLSAAQQVLYRLSAAALTAPQQAGQGRYVELSQVETGPAAHYPKNFRSLVNQKNLPRQLKSFYRSLVRKYGWKPKIVISKRTNVFDSRTGDIWEYQQAPSGGAGGTYVSRHGSPTQDQFAAWPTATRRLRALLLAQARALNDTVPGQTSDDLVFQQATNWLWNPLVTPALRAGLYKVLAATPGVVVKTGVRDATGRPAIEISRLDKTTKELSTTFEAPGPALCSNRSSATPAATCTCQLPATPPSRPTPTAAAEPGRRRCPLNGSDRTCGDAQNPNH